MNKELPVVANWCGSGNPHEEHDQTIPNAYIYRCLGFVDNKPILWRIDESDYDYSGTSIAKLTPLQAEFLRKAFTRKKGPTGYDIIPLWEQEISTYEDILKGYGIRDSSSSTRES